MSTDVRRATEHVEWLWWGAYGQGPAGFDLHLVRARAMRFWSMLISPPVEDATDV